MPGLTGGSRSRGLPRPERRGGKMQSYTYSVFSIVAVAIHLIFNFRMLTGRGVTTVYGKRYRGFLFGVLAYYISDAAWGIFAGLGWRGPWYVDTMFFFLSLAVFVVMWGRFAVDYLGFSRLTRRIVDWSGAALIATCIVALAVNPFTDCFFHIDAQGVYQVDFFRDPYFCLLVGFNVLGAALVLAKVVRSKDDARRRSVMVFTFSALIAFAIVLQVIWPLTPFTSLGCLVGNCFFHVFVVQDEKAARHMAALEKALERARAAEKARSMFFSIVSHDIRTPLNAILGYFELLQRGIESPEEKAEAFEAIRSSGTTLLQLVNDVLDLAKMDAGKIVLQPQPLLLSQLTQDVFATFRLAASGKGIKLVDGTAGVPPVLVDGHRFRQILFNLVGNVVKFTEKGSVTVSASYADGNLEVSVSDTGVGIPSDMLSRVLDPFVQVNDPSHASDRAGGTGLGLSICRRLAEVMGGDLVVESELGKGSTFCVRIPGVPSADGSAVPSVAAEQTIAPDRVPGRVLVVDDSPVNRSVLTAHLRKAGVAFTEKACDGAEAFAALDSAFRAGHPYDLVLTDFWMPNMNGLELVERLRADKRFQKLPVFAVTADTETSDDSRSRLFTGILLKPMTYAKLVQVFSSLPA